MVAFLPMRTLRDECIEMLEWISHGTCALKGMARLHRVDLRARAKPDVYRVPLVFLESAFDA